MDNAPCHPVDIIHSNVRLQYFSPNNTSMLQPLDQGIVHAFKAHYHKYLVKHIIACYATAQTPTGIKMTYLDTVYWIDLAW
jgi:DDE superfamily endonuclease